MINWPLQSLSDLPPPNTTPSPYSWVVLVVAVAVAIQFGTDYDLRDYVPSFGGGGGGGSSRSSSGGGGGGGILGFAMSLNGLAVGALTLLSALIVGGVVDVPEGAGVPFIVGLELTALLLILAEFEAVRENIELIVLVVIATVVLGLSALGEGIIGEIVNSPIGVIAVIGGLYLANRALDIWGKSKRTVVRVRGTVQDGDDS